MNTWVGQTQGDCSFGVNSAVRPDQIGPSQLAWMLNGTVRDGKPRTRPRITQRLVLPSGRVQGVGYFSLQDGQMVMQIEGHLYAISNNADTFTSTEIALGFYNSELIPEVWMCETDGYLLVQDGQSDCIIFDGATARRADQTLHEVPIGRQMAYGNGRLSVAVGEYTLKVGDINNGNPGSELIFTETDYLNGGGSFSFARKISALAFLPSNNTSSGYGSLIVFGKNNTQALRLEVTSRDLWQVIPGFEVVVLDNIGAIGQGSVVKVDQDLWWRDALGQVRSLRSASAAAEGPGNTPLSREVDRIVGYDTTAWLEECCGMYFDNRVFFTASPYLHTTGCKRFSNLISLDLAPTASMQGKSPPAYDGAWDGLNIVRLCKGSFSGQERAFAISTDNDGYNRLWEIEVDTGDDSYISGSTVVPVSIRSEVEFRRFDMGTPSQLKQLTRCDIYPAEIEGEISLSLYWRVGNRSQWLLCDTVEFCAEMTDADALLNLRAQERGRIKSFTFPALKDEIMQMAQTVGYSFQIRLVWEGSMLIDRIDIFANPLKDRQYSDIASLDTACQQNPVEDNEVSYSILG